MNTDVDIVRCAAETIATAPNMDELDRFAERLRNEKNVSKHDLALIRALWAAKRDWIQQSPEWEGLPNGE